ncbi:MAG: hypothetical protein H7Y60_02840 [Rhodospirillaceae bacterium]|nr:hypothetical protein [Rhodospirillales bacterium]
MKAIKALVVFMGILLVAGLGMIGYGVATKTGKPDMVAKPVSAAPVAGAQFGEITIPVPAGARLDQTLVVGQMVVLRVTGAGTERLIVLDPADGRITGSFVLSPENPKGR